MAKKTPAGQTKTGSQRTDSKPVGGSKGVDPRPDSRLTGGPTNEDSGPPGGRRSGPTGSQGITQREVDAVPFEEPTRTDTVRNRPMDEEGE